MKAGTARALGRLVALGLLLAGLTGCAVGGGSAVGGPRPWDPAQGRPVDPFSGYATGR